METAYKSNTAAIKVFLLYMAISFLCSSLASAGWIDQTDRGGIVTASSQIHDGEAKEMAFDNTTETKWLTDFTSTGWIQFQFNNNQKYTISKYSISSANDAAERDPRNWSLLGSIDGDSWVVVDQKTGIVWSERFQRREFTCSNPGEYSYYRLNITQNNGAGNLTGFSEMELLEFVYIAENPSPANNSENVSYHNTVLSWDAPAGLANPQYMVYISDSLELVESGDPSALRSVQHTTSYNVESLDSFTTFYWRVDVVDGGAAGLTWQFITQQPDIDCLTLAGDIDKDCIVNMADLELIAAQWLTGTCQAIPCADLNNSSKVDMADFAVVSSNWSAPASTVVLHEIMADNETTLADNFGEYSDWIEIKNLSDTAQNLAGWYLTDDKDDLTQWEFPGVDIQPKDYLIVFASGKDLTDNPLYLHTNFKLGKSGQYLALVRPDGSIAHEFNPGYPALGNDQVYGLTVLPDEENFVESLLASPTPGEFNSEAVVWSTPEFSVDSGMFESPFTLELLVDDPTLEIRYTFDCSIPDRKSTLYTGPIEISHSVCVRIAAFKDKYLPGKTVTHTYIFPDDVANQSANPAGFPTMWKSTVADYEMDPNFVHDEPYGPLLHDSLLSLPSISIVTEMDNLFDSNTGIYSNPLQEGIEWERPAYVELLTSDGSDTFQIDCGLRIQGGAFRGFNLTRKKSFRLLFKRQYGSGKLNFPLFDYDPDASDSFDTITLRAGANDGYSWSSAYQTEQYIRDEFGRSVQRDSGNTGSHGTFFHLYLNGLYWGLYNAVERPDNSFNATYNGGDKEQWDAINSGDLSEGSMDAWNSLITKCQEGVSGMAAYQEIQGNNPDGTINPEYPNLIDMENYIDYILINMWGGNGDWPHRNYWVGRERTDDSEGFQFFCWDFEGTMASPFAQFNKVIANFNVGAGIPHYNLSSNDEYRVLFGDRAHRLFFNDGALSTDVNIQRYTDLANWVEPAIVAESTRWADQHYETPPGLDEWRAKRDEIINYYLPTRTDDVLQQLRDAGYYPSIDAPVFKVNDSDQNGGYVNNDDDLSMVSLLPSLIDVNLVDEGDPVRVHVPYDNSLGNEWLHDVVFDSTWTNGTTGTGVGYERGSGYQDWIDTDVESAMYGRSTSVYCLIEFEYDASVKIEQLILKMRYDDGFIAYLADFQVARSGNITNSTPGSAVAGSHEAGVVYEEFDITGYQDILRNGKNVLAIHGINQSRTSSDMIISPILTMRYRSNQSTLPVMYTTDGSDPRLLGGAVNPAAIQYDGSVPLTQSMQVKARTYYNGQWSALNEALYSVGPVIDSLRISEIMYNPATDPNSEFIELANIGSESINLNMVRFTKGIDFQFGSVSIDAGQRIVIVRDIESFMAQYPEFDGVIAGQYEGSLDNSGERIKLVDALGVEIQDFEYKDSWYDITDGEGFTIIVRDLAGDVSLWDDKSGWRPGEVINGTPGTADSGQIPPLGSVVINELLAHSDTAQYDWIELHNTTDQPINIGGWYLSDNNDDDIKRKKYQIAEGTVIPANGYKVFYENIHFGNETDPGCSIPFQFSENGETVYLQSGHDGVLTGYYTEEDFGASQRDIAFGRYQKSSGSFNFVATSSNTPGADNAYPKVGPVVITEIMYHPANNSDAEYVELENISSIPATLFDDETGIAWRLVDDKDDIGLEYNFPVDSPVTMLPGEKILLVKDLSAFTEEFGAPASTLQVYQWLNGSLSNKSEKPELQLPGDVDEQLNQYYIRVDRVSYEDDLPWPDEADGDGMSLTRISNNLYGNDAVNWQAEAPTPGV